MLQVATVTLVPLRINSK